MADRYAQGSPVELLPFGVKHLLIVGANDPVMPAPMRESYAARVALKGDSVEVLEVPGSHFEVIAPTSAAWPTVRDKVLALLK